MKRFILIVFLAFGQFAFAQDLPLRTYSGKIAEDTTCIFNINLVRIIQAGTLHNEVSKPKVTDLLKHFVSCNAQYKFVDQFEDKAFKLLIPKYISKSSYELGNQHFAIALNDSLYERSIVFTYDLDDSYRDYFLTHNGQGFTKLKPVILKGRKIYRFKNWDDRIAGTIFTTNHLHVSYFTKSKVYERELQEVISKFNW